MLRKESPKLVSKTRICVRSFLLFALVAAFSLPFGVLANGDDDHGSGPAGGAAGAK